MLNKTCKDEDFFKVFKELEHEQSLDLPNNNKLEMYYTKIMNNRFEYTALIELLSNNITNYVFSRKENIEANEKNKIQSLTIKAINEFRKIKNDNDSGSGGELGEFLLYTFLESRLNAFKLLSKMELKTNSSDYIKGADEIYLYDYEEEKKQEHFEYIIGEAKIEGTSSEAIKDAIDSILIHLQNENFEKELVNREIFKETFSEDEVEKIRNILVPRQDNDDMDIQKAFGIFIGYGIEKSLNLDGVSNPDGKVLIEERMKKDIENICKNMKKKIVEKKLTNYSFYVYVMPFKNAKEERKEILKNMAIGD